MPIKINGSTSGSVTLAAPATGSDVTVTLPTDLNAKAPLNMSVNPQTGTSYTLTTSDSANIITMTNAAASTVTIPTNASAAIPIGTSTEIVNLSTGVNTTVSAAGGVTFNGGPVVLSPGSSVTLVKIGTDAWMAQGQGSPGLVHIATSSFSGVSSVNVNNCFTSTYQNYRLVIDMVASAQNNQFLRMRASGSDNTSANYTKAFNGMYVNNTTANVGNTGNTSWDLLQAAATFYTIMVIDMIYPQASTQTVMTFQGFSVNSTAQYAHSGGGIHNVQSAFDGITLGASAGTMSGSIRIYGYRN